MGRKEADMEIFMMETSEKTCGGRKQCDCGNPHGQENFSSNYSYFRLASKSAESDSFKCWLNGFARLQGMASNFSKM